MVYIELGLVDWDEATILADLFLVDSVRVNTFNITLLIDGLTLILAAKRSSFTVP